MPSGEKSKNKEKLFIYISAILIVLILSLGGIYLVLSWTNSQLDDSPTLAVEYQNISASKAHQIYTSRNTSDYEGINLTIIDVRRFDYSCNCQLHPKYEEGRLPGAILDENPIAEDYYNITSDLLIYTQDGINERGLEFCKALIGHVYGKIYFLKGGYEAWEENGYYVEKGSFE